MIKICERCQQRYIIDSCCTDFVHECNSGSDVLDKESVFVIGDWTDYTGSGVVNNALLQGLVSDSKGTNSGIRGNEDEPTNVFGDNKSTHRLRKHLEFIETK